MDSVLVGRVIPFEVSVHEKRGFAHGSVGYIAVFYSYFGWIH